MKKESKIFVAGHAGLVGSSIVRELNRQGFYNIVVRNREELSLLDQVAVKEFFNKERPEYVFLAAAKVGGILANKEQKADFIYENLEIQNNVIYNAYASGVKKLLFLGSSCIYPKASPQPIKEEYLLSGSLEETNDAYAVAKIAGIKMCQSFNEQYGTCFISVMPTNLYGPNDNFDLHSSHVLPALIRKFHEAKKNNDPEVILWGSGIPKREFLHVDDLASAVIFLMESYAENQIVNIGTGEDISIANLAEIIKSVVGYEGKIVWDNEKPDGVLRKLLDVNRLENLGWKYRIKLRDGIEATYDWYLQSLN